LEIITIEDKLEEDVSEENPPKRRAALDAMIDLGQRRSFALPNPSIADHRIVHKWILTGCIKATPGISEGQ
jgi:hypothetical protein